MAWRYIDQPYAPYATSLFDDYPQPALPRQDVQQRPQEPPPGFAYQTVLNSFALAELNHRARPYLAQIAGWLPLELGVHSRSGGLRRGNISWKEAEREREQQLEWGGTRDPRFEWGEFPRTVGWEARRAWRAEREEEERRVRGNGNEEAHHYDERHTQTAQSDVEDRIDQQLDEPQLDVQIDFRTSTVAQAPADSRPARSNASVSIQPRREKAIKKRVTWPRELKNRYTAPVVESRFEHYWQWAHRFSDLILKMEQDDQGIKKLEAEMPAHTDYESDARSLEPQSQPHASRSKYNPKADPDYHKPPPEPIFQLPIAKNNAPLIKPHLPRHRQAQPKKSSFLQRTGRRFMEALSSGYETLRAGVRRGIGAAPARPTPVERAVEAQPAPAEIRPAPDEARPVPPVEETLPLPTSTTAPRVNANENEKADTNERFFTRPQSPPSESEEEDVLATLPLRSTGISVKDKRQKTPAVTIHTTRSLDVGEARLEFGPQVTADTRQSLEDAVPAALPSPDDIDFSAPVTALPEIGTGAARPMTRDNTAFNAAQLDFVPIPSDIPIVPPRPIRNLPPTATDKEREIARANDRYHRHMAQWEGYLRSLASANPDDGEVYREADTWKDIEEDDASWRSHNRDGRWRRRRRADVSDDSDWSGDEWGREPGARDRRPEHDRNGSDDIEQPDERPHQRLHSPPPERRVLNVDEIDDDDDDREDYETWARRIQETLKKYDKRYEPEVVDSDDSDAVNPDFRDIDLDDDLELEVDEIEIPELGAAPLYGSGFNRDRVMPKIRRPDHDRERDREYKRRQDRRQRELDERRGSRWASGRPGQRMYGGFGN